MKRNNRFLVLMLVFVFGVGVSGLYAQAPAETAATAPLDSTCTPPTDPITFGSTEHTLIVDDLERVYRVYLPSGYDGEQRLPVVISLHGVISTATEQEEKTGWSTLAESENFIAVYPQGARPAFFAWGWNAGKELAGEMRAESKTLSGEMVMADDVSFFEAFFAHLNETLCIDPSRIYVNGFSNGGGMTNHLACALSDKIAAVGTVSGAFSPIESGCEPVHPLPVIAFQGLDDRTVPAAGNEKLGLEGVESWAATWAARNGCAENATPIEHPADSVSAYVYSDCTTDADVAVYLLSDTGHTWAGGGWGDSWLQGKTNHDINTNETMWAFFKPHSLTTLTVEAADAE